MVHLSRAGPWALVGSVCLAALIFVVDLLSPIGIAVPALYAIPVLLSLWLPSRPHTLVIAAVSTALTCVGLFVSPPGDLWIGLGNRVVTVALIWAVTLVVLLRKRAEERIKLLEGLIPICAGCKKIRNDEGYWDVLESYIQQHSEAAFTHGLCPECVEHYYGTTAENAK